MPYTRYPTHQCQGCKTRRYQMTTPRTWRMQQGRLLCLRCQGGAPALPIRHESLEWEFGLFNILGGDDW